MKTESLIAALSADTAQEMPERRRLWFALAGGAVVAAFVFVLLLGPRPDFLEAIRTIRFDFKFVLALALAASAFVALRRATRPEMGEGPLARILLLAPSLLLVAVILEFFAVPSAAWAARWIGHNWLYCMIFIPTLSLGPLVVLLFALRSGATTQPVRTGALAGLLAGGVGALFYAAHCPDDSPFFVASWYTIAIAFVTFVGALSGSRLLRW